MGKRIAIMQSNYIPWKGYFDLINLADEFVLYDDAQYTRRDWRNRNLIKTPTGLRWLTIPVQVKSKFHQKIQETAISDPRWTAVHWKTLIRNYSRAPHFHRYRDAFEELYLGTHETMLSRVNRRFLGAICDLLGIKTTISWSMEYRLAEGQTEKLVEICRQTYATEYLSGPTAKGYLDEKQFRQAGIALRYMDYSGYPEYNQLYPPFEHRVSILDLIFHEGPKATAYMKSF